MLDKISSLLSMIATALGIVQPNPVAPAAPAANSAVPARP
jgi:hypothetical protein